MGGVFLLPFISIVIAITFNQFLWAQPDQPIVKIIGNLASCVQNNAYEGHQIKKLDDGNYVGIINFLPFHLPDTPEQIAINKQKWKEWDQKGPQPADSRRLGVKVPLQSRQNIKTTDLERLSATKDRFDKLFKSIENATYIPIDFNTLTFSIKKEDCVTIEVEDLINVTCYSNDVYKKNDIEVTSTVLSFSMMTEEEIVLDEATSEYKVEKTYLVNTDLELRILDPDRQVPGGGLVYDKIYSRFSYTPNGNDVQCELLDKIIK